MHNKCEKGIDSVTVSVWPACLHGKCVRCWLHMCGSKLQNVQVVIVKIDKNICWKNQVDNVGRKVRSDIAFLPRINDYLPVEIRITYYKTFIQPHIDFYNIIWGQPNQQKSMCGWMNVLQYVIRVSTGR